MESTKNMARPKLERLFDGEELKVLKVTVPSGSQMPTHHATSEAVISVVSGEAVLAIGGEEHTLKVGDIFLIPANKSHSVKVGDKEFHAFLTLSDKGKIEFE